MNAHELPDHVVTWRENRSSTLPLLFDFFFVIEALSLKPGEKTSWLLVAASLFLFGLFIVDQFRKAPARAPLRFFWVEESKPFLFELVEELLPRNLLECFFAGVPREVDSKDSRIVARACALHRRWLAAAVLSPFLD